MGGITMSSIFREIEEEKKAKFRLAATAITLAAVTALGYYTNITTGWLSSLYFVGGALCGMVGTDNENSYVPIMTGVRRAVCALAMATVIVPIYRWSTIDDKVLEADHTASRAALHYVLDGKDVAEGCGYYQAHAVIRKWGEETGIRRAAKIISRQEPIDIGNPGLAEVEVDGNNLDGSARRFVFEIVKEPDGTISYYEKVLAVKWTGGVSGSSMTLDERKPYFWGKRGEKVAGMCR
jgi:hypothetical protein